MARLVMEAELKDKHNSKKKLKNIIRRLKFDLKRKVSFILFTAIIYQLNIAIKSRSKATGLCHEKKLKNLRKAQNSTMKDDVVLNLLNTRFTIIHPTYFLNRKRLLYHLGQSNIFLTDLTKTQSTLSSSNFIKEYSVTYGIYHNMISTELKQR